MSPRYAQYCMIIALYKIKTHNANSWRAQLVIYKQRYSPNTIFFRYPHKKMTNWSLLLDNTVTLYQAAQVSVATSPDSPVHSKAFTDNEWEDMWVVPGRSLVSRQESSPWSVVRCLYSHEESSVTIFYDVERNWQRNRHLEREI